MLTSHKWPGNGRELQNVIERGVILSGGSPELEPEHLGFAPSEPAPVGEPLLTAETPAPTAAAVVAGEPLPLSELERQHILRVIQASQNNRTQAAKKLGISVRTLRNKLKEYGEDAGPASDAA